MWAAMKIYSLSTQRRSKCLTYYQDDGEHWHKEGANVLLTTRMMGNTGTKKEQMSCLIPEWWETLTQRKNKCLTYYQNDGKHWHKEGENVLPTTRMMGNTDTKKEQMSYLLPEWWETLAQRRNKCLAYYQNDGKHWHKERANVLLTTRMMGNTDIKKEQISCLLPEWWETLTQRRSKCLAYYQNDGKHLHKEGANVLLTTRMMGNTGTKKEQMSCLLPEWWETLTQRRNKCLAYYQNDGKRWHKEGTNVLATTRMMGNTDTKKEQMSCLLPEWWETLTQRRNKCLAYYQNDGKHWHKEGANVLLTTRRMGNTDTKKEQMSCLTYYQDDGKHWYK